MPPADEADSTNKQRVRCTIHGKLAPSESKGGFCHYCGRELKAPREKAKATHERKERRENGTGTVYQKSNDQWLGRVTLPAFGGPIKIGIARDPKRRLKDLQIGSPFELKILHVIPNVSLEMEQRLHHRFARSRSHGEWFYPRDVNRYLKNLQREGGNSEC